MNYYHYLVAKTERFKYGKNIKATYGPRLYSKIQYTCCRY